MLQTLYKTAANVISVGLLSHLNTKWKYGFSPASNEHRKNADDLRQRKIKTIAVEVVLQKGMQQPLGAIM